MSKRFQKAFAFMLAVIMAMTINIPNGMLGIFDFVKPVNAAELQEPATDENGVYQIGTIGELYWFAAHVNGTLEDGFYDIDACAVLTADIADTTGGQWTPIGIDTILLPYTGVFNGKGHTISGLNFDDSNTGSVGLFGCSSGTITNVVVENSYFCGDNNVGGVCGYNEGTISNCHYTGKVNGSSYVGGVCGYNEGTISNCYNTGEVGSLYLPQYVGGVCGYNDEGGTISNCYNTGKVGGSYNSQYVGGVCGYNDEGGTISNCYNTGEVGGSDNSQYVGGVCGYNNGGTISNCYNTGEVGSSNCPQYAGGVCGDNYGTISNCYNTGEVGGLTYVGGVCGTNDGEITSCYNTGKVGDSNTVLNGGGVCGYNGGTITSCYNTGTVSGSEYSSKYIGGVCGTNDGEITSCYNTGEVNGFYNIGSVCGKNGKNGTFTSCYYNSSNYIENPIGANSGTANYIYGKDTDSFKSGEVCYLLSQGENGSVWGQTIGTDDYPILNGKKVYYSEAADPHYYNNFVLGDVSGNDTIDKADAVLVLRYISGIITFNDYQLSIADANSDDKVNMLDVIKILGSVS